MILPPEAVATVLVAIGSGVVYLIYGQGQQNVKINTMWDWFTNHGSDITGYKKDERKK